MHNHKILNDKPNETGIGKCNCPKKGTCPVTNTCQTKSVVCQAYNDCAIAAYKRKCYLDSCETKFKESFPESKRVVQLH